MPEVYTNRRTLLAGGAAGAVVSVLPANHADAAKIATRFAAADKRARALVAKLTLDEKLSLMRSSMFFGGGTPKNPMPADALGTAGYAPGVARLNIPAQQQSDASLGVAPGPNPRPEREHVTAFPASIALACGWDPDLAEEVGKAVGAEARARGINIMLAGGVNLARDPRCGRNFEYVGEDPLLAGHIAGRAIKGIQSQDVVSTIKHFALNAQETGRNLVDESIDEGALQESDLLAFKIAIEIGAPGSVMCAYNKINGDHASQNKRLLHDILKHDWRYPGWVMSDWGSVYSTREALLAGLDQQSGYELDGKPYFGAPLKALAESDKDVVARIDDAAHRILVGMIACGVFENPPKVDEQADFSAHRDLAQRAAEAGIVLLKNEGAALPLSEGVKSIAVIGAKADVGVWSGAGSSNVVPEGSLKAPAKGPIPGMPQVYHLSSPLRSIAAIASAATVVFHSGDDVASAAALAAKSDIVILFAARWDSEGGDAADLSLPNGQDALIDAVAAANAKTIVVLETGGPVLTPWLSRVAALLQAWYPGQRGGEAIARILFGRAEPTGRLSISFPKSVQDLPRPDIPGYADPKTRQGLTRFGPAFSSQHNEGADIGYRWHFKRGQTPLFPFGFGLTYTTFSMAELNVQNAKDDMSVTCAVTNTGERAGAQTVQIYALPPAQGAVKRLVGFAKIRLAPGETKVVEIPVELRLLARFDVDANCWRIDAGNYALCAGDSSMNTPLKADVTLKARALKV